MRSIKMLFVTLLFSVTLLAGPCPIGATGTDASAVAATPSVAPSSLPADWWPAAMSEFLKWALDVAYKMSASGPYIGPSRTPADLRRLIGGCDPQAREKPTLSLDFLCGNAPDGVFADQADFLAIVHGALPAGFDKVACPAASTLPVYLEKAVLLECFRNSNGTEIELEYNTDTQIKGKFGISVVALPHN